MFQILLLKTARYLPVMKVFKSVNKDITLKNWTIIHMCFSKTLYDLPNEIKYRKITSIAQVKVTK